MSGIDRYLALVASAPRRARAAKRAKPELNLQMMVIAKLRETFPYMQVRGIDNNNMSVRRGAQMKAAGIEAGTPDIICICESGLHIWIELKRGDKNITESSFSQPQKDFRDWCLKYGIAWFAENSVEGAVRAVMQARGMV